MKEFWGNFKRHRFFIIFIMVIMVVLLNKAIDYVPGFWYRITEISSKMFNICQPIIIAAIMSYILKPLVNLLDKVYFKLFYKVKKDQNPVEIVSKKQFSRIRLLTVVTVLLVLGSAFAILITFILEPFLKSLKSLIIQLPDYLNIVLEFLGNFEIDPNIINNINEKVAYFLNNNLKNVLDISISAVTSLISSTGTFIFNFLVAVILSVYILRDKEKIAKFFSTLSDVIFRNKISMKIKNFVLDFDQIFSGYFTGVIVDAIFVGVCSFILTYIIKNPYALIIGVLAGVSNVIPYLGPLIGAIGAFVLGLPSGFSTAIIGFLLLMAFQQIEGNLIQPKILGDFVGLSPLVVIVSLIVGGGLFGIAGIILSSPVVGIISLYYKRYLKKINKGI
ncbi:AI-2E family transporter [Candidatus Arthromitus sp. SFB-rat-Yit]|uniref:AI-2E family transporter n=1 Tax=Candidatus Arthromitus sp. SFB-rat-Yit TaxID=1041504 RepID=UPI00031B902B|nr:AI-2E family transporter [Candidatus Arthromitus sp. SFB-rat-Yit]